MVRAACPDIPVGTSRGYWILPDVAAQVAAAHTLLDLGIGLAAGLWTAASVRSFLTWPERHRVIRVLLELPNQPERVVRPEVQAMLDLLSVTP